MNASASTVSDAGTASGSRAADSTRQVLWLTGTALLLLVIVAVVALVVVTRELHAARTSHVELQRGREAIEQAQLVLSALQDAETGERGYVISGSDTFLDPYVAAGNALDSHLRELDRLVIDSHSRTMLDDLSVRSHAQLQFLGSVIDLRRAQGEQAAAEVVRQGQGKQQMDRIRAIGAALIAREKALVTDRLAQFQKGSARSERTVQIALSAAVLLVLTAGALLLAHTRRRFVAEKTAVDALSLLRSTMDNVTQGVAVFDPSQKLLAWNARYIELRGIDASQVVAGMHLGEIMRMGTLLSVQTEKGPMDGRTMTTSMIDVARGYDMEASRADGKILLVRGRPMPGGNFIITYTDVTALKVSEAAYREQATRLSAILDSVVDAIVTINESGSIESWSKGAERLFGYEASEVLRRNVRILMPDPHSSAHDGYIRRYIQTGERRIMGQRREVEAQHKDGRRIPVDLGISEMTIGSRRLFIGIVRDLSSRIEVERLKAGFVSTVSHELRTPLTSISGSLGLLAGGVAGELPAKATRLIDIAKLNCERLVRLINDILDLEKAESGKLEFRLESQRLKPIVQHAIDLNRSYAHNYGATIELDAEGDDANVFVDRDRLIQVLTNLLSNAAKFSPRGGIVHVFIRAEADSVCISVRDQGPGIGAEFQKRIFEKFAQADSSDSRAKGGTGLGLSIVKTIVERLGGNISFDTAQGKGAVFHISLPLHQEPVALVHSSTGAFAGPAVLICEDDPDVARILVDILRQEGMRAEAVSNARAARAALDAVRFDVALIDLHLPDADGLDFITELRAREATKGLPVIVVTARSRNSSDAAHVSALQLADWLQKPIDPRRLLDAIHNVLSQPRDRRARILHVEDDESLTLLVNELLSEEADVVAAHSLAEARRAVNSGQYDLVILDITLGDGSGLDILPLLRRPGRVAPPVILYSASEPSRELTGLVQAALVKSRDSVEQLLESVRQLAGQKR